MIMEQHLYLSGDGYEGLMGRPGGSSVGASAGEMALDGELWSRLVLHLGSYVSNWPAPDLTAAKMADDDITIFSPLGAMLHWLRIQRFWRTLILKFASACPPGSNVFASS
ncbi:unnamed protein product [Heligmosomoides polygyrus]|uniref:Uncharacterized protein n=1 Tax=Heligmosomoides polygyrus TaxID=6339 RepID=A0A183FTS3_HELPZ|nr:unnamed protein product [Heligmosomoides polygyrus]